MTDNDRLARLILEPVGEAGSERTAEIEELLRAALTTARSRLDLRDKLFALARGTNHYTVNDIAEVISEHLSDYIRDIDDQIDALEAALLPSRFISSTSIAAVVGALTGLIYGVADITTALGSAGVMCLVFFGTQVYRRRARALISTLRKRRADYDGFRSLLRNR